MRFLHAMLRVSDPDATIRFFNLLGLEERRRMENEAGRFTLIFLGVPGDDGGEVELTYNWDEAGYDGGRNFGHLAYQVDDIYETCQRLMDNGRDDQPPAARRAHGVRPIARQYLDRASAEGRSARAGRALGVDAEHGRMVGWRDRRFLGLVGTEHPIIQAPMAGAAGVELAVAAIDGGGLGSLPCALLRPDRSAQQVADVRSSATGPLNLNFFCHTMPADADDSAWRALLRPYYDEYRRAAGERRTAAPAVRRRRCAPWSRSSGPRSSASTSACPTPGCSTG